MKPYISIAALSATALLLAVSAQAMQVAKPVFHSTPGWAALYEKASATKLKRSAKPGLGLKARGGRSHIQDNCVYGNDGITRCDDCEVDWDANPRVNVCIAGLICYNNDGERVDC